MHRVLRELNWNYQDSRTGSTRLSSRTFRQRALLRAYSEIYYLRAQQILVSMYVVKFHVGCVIGSLPDGTVVRKPRLHRARGLGDGLGRQDVWATQRLLECERSWRRGYSGQFLSSLYPLKS